MSNSSLNKCFLCGKAASDRCSSCANAGYSMYFCSRDHQKLSWPVHKYTCGKNSNPFRWPRLSDADADEMIATRHQRAELLPLPDGTEKLVSLDERWRLQQDELDLKDVINSLRKNYKGSPLLTDVTIQQALYFFRSLQVKRLTKRYTAKSTSKPEEGAVTSMDCDEYAQLCDFVDGIIPIPDYSPETHFWWSEIMHRWLALVHLLRFLPRDGTWKLDEEQKDAYRCARWIANDTIRFINEKIKPADPTTARGPLVEEFLRWKMLYQPVI
ncbi:hypothetical protein JCM3765_004753 [Sporobolomyces pararoseus]